MNRRNFMKTFALAVGVSPLALAARPDRIGDFYDFNINPNFRNYLQSPTVDPKDPEFLRQFRAAMKNTKFKKPFKGHMRMTADVLHGLEGLEREE